ncbi:MULTISPECIES: hypothetical protein [Photorhabdus]|uniref:Uncharacterized protein n=1 Tax=Photorhabdus kayaii TaxID=230088 RepID=A0ABX0AYX0_9GAMM|nr:MULTISPECIES: hypothetical protein [Photorhabdus]MCC8374514.1 hypothetical protein [Photorhabdus bodei]MCT8354348.1 hypothetical protein [Photorhabdus kayaii]MDB6368626.1 hypothetical protein [Photorhabdus bodei]NDL12460.1 hypothetical protein [Photorhabdus kayaii]NDL26042.1 hypothetical protein [Photorhabdus kayaii]
MDAKLLQKAYVSLLYSDHYRIADAEKEYGYIHSTMNGDRIVIERAARRRNLRTVLYADMHFAPHFFSKDFFLELVNQYCESDSFWNWNSRTLIESFCYFVCKHAGLREEEKILFLIDGIYSGISTGMEDSPWSSTISRTHENTLTEEIDCNLYFMLAQLNTANSLKEMNFKNKSARLRFHNENGKVALSCREAV